MSSLVSVRRCSLVVVLGLSAVNYLRADEGSARARKAAERSTLDQKGTHPFHLKAAIAPSQVRDKDSGRTGDLEIWWRAPGEYRREIRTTGFHQLQIVSSGRVW